MTEVEWQAVAGWQPMFDHVRTRASTRKVLLLAVALCRRIWDRFPEEDCRQCVQALERLSDNPLVGSEDRSVATDLDAWFVTLQQGYPRVIEAGAQPLSAYNAATACAVMWHDPDAYINEVAKNAALAVSGSASGSEWNTEQQAQARLLHELFGNPFRPVAFEPRWRSETAVALAAGIYAERAFDRLPILADALEEAGCDHADLLAHLRCPGPHVRGCWVVDLVLGKG